MADILAVARRLDKVISCTMEDAPGMGQIVIKNIAVTPEPWFKNYIGIIIINLSKHQIEITKEQIGDSNYSETIHCASELSKMLEWKVKITKY